MEINKSNLKTFRAEFAEAVKTLEKKHAVKIALGNISFSSEQFSSKITVQNLDGGGSPSVKNGTWRLYAYLFNVNPEWEGRTFRTTNSAEDLKIVGLNPRRPKNPVELIGVTSGKSFKCPIEYVKVFLS